MSQRNEAIARPPGPDPSELASSVPRGDSRPAGLRRFARRHAGVLVLIGASVVLLANLGGYPIWELDEARHALIARELHRASDWRGWLLPHLDGHPYRDKPILFYWLAAVAYAIVGERELAVRLVPALSALGVVAALYRWARRMWGTRAAVLGAMVVTTTAEFLALGRYANLDMLLTLWLTLGVLAVHRWASDANGEATLRPAALMAGLGCLTKGLVAPVLIATIGGAYVWTSPRPPGRGPVRIGELVAILLAVAAPWYVVAGMLDPAYLREFFLEHHLVRFLQPSSHLHPEPFWFTPTAALVGFLPWAVLLPAVALWLRDRPTWDGGMRLCLWWVAAVVAFFTVSGGKLATYVPPAMPALGMLTGRWLSGLETERRDARVARAALAATAVPTAVVGVGAVVGAVVFARDVPVEWSSLAPAAGTSLIALASMVAVLIAARRTTVAAGVLGVATLVAAGFVYGPAAGRISAVVSDAEIARIVQTTDPGGRRPLVAFGVRHPSLSYYTERPIRYVDRVGRLRRILARRPHAFVVTRTANVPSMLRAGPLIRWAGATHELYSLDAPECGGF